MPSNAGRPQLAMRLRISLLHPKHAENLSDEALVARWSENVVWQYFCGQEYYEPKLPCDATQLGRFRAAIGEAAVEEILKATIDTALAMDAINPTEFERVIVDTTVQVKAVAYPTDSRLLEAARRALVKSAKALGIELKQIFQREGKHLRWKAGRYGHARQFLRLARVARRQRTIVGRLLREIKRKAEAIDMTAKQFERFTELLVRCELTPTSGFVESMRTTPASRSCIGASSRVSPSSSASGSNAARRWSPPSATPKATAAWTSAG